MAALIVLHYTAGDGLDSVVQSAEGRVCGGIKQSLAANFVQWRRRFKVQSAAI